MSYAAEIFIRFGLETDVAYNSGEFRGNAWRNPIQAFILDCREGSLGFR